MFVFAEKIILNQYLQNTSTAEKTIPKINTGTVYRLKCQSQVSIKAGTAQLPQKRQRKLHRTY